MSDILESVIDISGRSSLFDDLQKEYIKNRTLVFNNEVADDVVEDIVMWILQWNREDKHIPVENRVPIKLFISSPGGNVFNANNLIDVITQSKTPVIGICLDMAASAAFLVLLACHKRWGFYRSAYLMHEGTLAIENSRSKFKQTTDFLDKMDVKAKEYILSRTKITSEFYDEVYDQEYWQDSQTALENGVIDGIIGEDISLEELL